MIEVFTADYAVSLGQYPHFNAAAGSLRDFVRAEISGNTPSVIVCCYRNNEPVREYRAIYSRGKWRRVRRPKSKARCDTNGGFIENNIN